MNINIPYDKLLHFAVCVILSTLMRWCGIEWYITLPVVISIGIIKEIYDKVSGKGTPENKDLLADKAGAVIGAF